MIAVIFEVWPAENGGREAYLDLAAKLKADLERIDGFNNRRLLESTGNVRLAELEMQYLRQRSESAIPP